MSLRDIRNGTPPYIPTRQQTSIGRQMAVKREVWGLSQEELAKKAGVRPLAVQAWETGPVLIESLQGILKALGCHLIVTNDTVTLFNGRAPRSWGG